MKRKLHVRNDRRFSGPLTISTVQRPWDEDHDASTALVLNRIARSMPVDFAVPAM